VKNLIIAKRYAKALFNIALEDQQIEQYEQEMSDFVRLLDQLPDLADAIQNPLYPVKAKMSVFQAFSEKSDMTPTLGSFIALLIEKDRVKYLDEITECYHRLIDEHQNVARAQVSAATHLDESTIASIAQTLEQIVGKKIIVEFEKDPELIGGVMARIGDLVLDGSVRTQLYNMKESLKRGELG
jgi:F-type H+-transporting ATPase subunit delta